MFDCPWQPLQEYPASNCLNPSNNHIWLCRHSTSSAPLRILLLNALISCFGFLIYEVGFPLRFPHFLFHIAQYLKNEAQVFWNLSIPYCSSFTFLFFFPFHQVTQHLIASSHWKDINLFTRVSIQQFIVQRGGWV